MPRLTTPAAIRVYAAAQRFIDSALCVDDSLFTPGASIWAPAVIDDLYHRFAEHPDESPDSFEPKFRRQLHGDALTPPTDAAPATYQLAAELLYMHLLPANGISGAKKRQIVGNVLGWSPAPVAIPADLAQALDEGIAKASQFFLAGRNSQVQFLLEFARTWKRLDPAERTQRLVNPWDFKQFLFGLPVRSAFAQRDLLLHLIHPETFEPIMAPKHKQEIAAAFSNLLDPSIKDVDQQLAQIRAQLARQYGEVFHFYDDRIKVRWLTKTEPIDQSGRTAVTGAQAGLSGTEQMRLALQAMVANGGMASSQQIYASVEAEMRGQALSKQGRDTLRSLVSREAVNKGYVEPYDEERPGWHINDTGKNWLEMSSVTVDDDVDDAEESGEPDLSLLPRSLGEALRPYTTLATHLTDDVYTPAGIRDLLVKVVPPIAPGVTPPEPALLVDELLRLRLLEPLDDGRYRRWPHLADATPELMLRYAALTLLVPAGEDAYTLPALTAPLTGLPHPADAWPLGEPLLRWYEEASLAQRNADGTWQSLPGALDPLDDPRPTAQAINTFLSSLRRARSSPTDLPALADTPLRVLSPAVLEERIAEIQRELLIDRETILRIYRSLIAGHHVILSGPPGTGKTHLARMLPRILWRDEQETVRLALPNDPALAPTESPLEDPLHREGYLVEVVTATEDWGVRHVIGGIAPKIQRHDHGSTLIYSVAHGCLTRAVLANYQVDGDLSAEPVELPRREHTDGNGNRYRGFWLVIDEFTRAQVDAAFGGLLTTLGGQRQPTLTFPTDEGERTVRLPRDFRLIGTLNSFDRHFLNQISEAMKRRFTFIDVLPPGRERREEEQAMAIYRAVSALAEQGLPGFSAEPELGRASWARILSVHRLTQSAAGSSLVRYNVEWQKDPVATIVVAALWRIFEAARVYRQLGTAQAETAYRTLFAGGAAGLTWQQALDAALADTLADQLQVIARDELRALLLLLDHPDDSVALRDGLVNLLNGLAGPRQSAHLLQLRLAAPGVDLGRPNALTSEQVEAIFGAPAPLFMPPTGLFARRLTAFVNEQGL